MTVNASSLLRISVSSGGTSANNVATGGVMSADGRYVVFQSTATNLVGGDVNGFFDVFLHDTLTGITTLLSTATGGTQGNNVSSVAAISDDGRYVFFNSTATNLVGGDTNAVLDIFMRDTLTGVTTRVSTASDGSQANGASQNVDVTADGAFIGFQSTATNLVGGDSNGFSDAFVKNLATGAVTRISVADDESQANGNSLVARLSNDGNRVSFVSSASNLTANDTNGAVTDIFVRDIAAGTTTLVSVSTGGGSGDGQSSGATISGNGRYVVFQSDATNLVAGDTNGTTDIFVRDLQTNNTTRVSTATDGSQSNDLSGQVVISADGRYVVFFSLASNLVQGDTNGLRDIFVRDMVTGTVTRLSVAADGTELNDLSNTPSISADGRYVTFQTQATDTGVGAEGNGTGFDVFRISLVASAIADRMIGSDGNDTIDGLGGDDIITGGFGNDVIDGGTGADAMSGGAGDDTYVVDDAGDTLTEVSGTDTVNSAITFSLAGLSIENLTLIGSANINATGNDVANVVTGNSGNNTLDGGAGSDAMSGGSGDDTYFVDDAGDTVTEAVGDGTDTVNSAVTFSLAGQFVNNLTLLGSANINGTGNGLSNVLTGNTGSNILDGAGGADTIDGGAGADAMSGGSGDDTYAVDDAGDTVTEADGDGTDTVNSAVTFSLAGQFAENLTLTGSATINATGNNLANTLIGNSAANTLEGGIGADQMSGLAGNDTYRVDNIGDVADETVAGSNGVDRVFSSISFSLVTVAGVTQAKGFIEGVVLIGAADTYAYGNAAPNTLVGSTGSNLLAAGAGNDTLAGRGGNDFFLFNTALNATTNVDTITDMNEDGDDTIQLENAVFRTLSPGALLADFFRISTTGALDANDQIIYNDVTGELFYDNNGNAGGGSTLFARLDTGLALTAADFVVV